MRLCLCAALLLPAVHPCTLRSQTPPPRRPMTFEDMQRMRRLDDLSLSPDGHWVLFAVTDVDLQQNRKTSHLWVVPTGVGSKPMEEKPVTAALAGEGHGASPRMVRRYFFKARAKGNSRSTLRASTRIAALWGMHSR